MFSPDVVTVPGPRMLAVWLGLLCWGVGLAANTPATAPAPLAAAVVLPVPEEAAQRQALATLHDTFAADYLKTNPAGQAALAQQMLALAGQTQDDAAARYMLLVEARRLALATGDVPCAMDAAGQIIAGFAVDRGSWWNGTLEELSKRNGLELAEAKLLCRAWYTAGTAAFAAEDYRTLNRCIQQATAVASRSRDADLLAGTQAKFHRWQQVVVAYGLDKEALARLKQDPTDAKASTSIGRFYGFYRGDWDKGLPLLAQGDDGALRDLARRDLQPHADSAAQVQMGDAWWDYAGKQENPLAGWIRERASYWYEKALPSLGGLTAVRVQGRINQAAPQSKAIDLLSLLNEAQWQKSGWKKTAEGWVSPDKNPELVFPYVPPDEYDFRVEFTSASDSPFVMQALVFGQRAFHWVIGNYATLTCGLDPVGGKGYLDNVTTTKKVASLKAGQPHTSLVRIRDKSITVLVDGKVVEDFATDYADVGSQAGNQGRLGFFIQGSGTNRLSVAEITEVSGKGMVVKEP